MCNLYQILRTALWKHFEAHLRTNTRSSMGSSETIGSVAETICWLQKLMVTRQSLSFWLHRTTYLGSSKCLIHLSPIRAMRMKTWSPQPSLTMSYWSVIGVRWTRDFDGWNSRRSCVRFSLRGKWQVILSVSFREGVSVPPPPLLPLRPPQSAQPPHPPLPKQALGHPSMVALLHIPPRLMLISPQSMIALRRE
ncbi:hypothetical protein Syun_003900 [Stephania yunnanensis]|uniref:Uncharacterized protein n=1 Tax=Stephania yunnanensis TaxID=152371 RepID=A0AAP0Q0N5_9MAGN